MSAQTILKKRPYKVGDGEAKKYPVKISEEIMPEFEDLNIKMAF